MNQNKAINFVFFGGEPLAVPVLEELTAAALRPPAVVASPDRPVGRKQILTPPPAKVWAEENNVPVWQPEGWKGEAAQKTAEQFFAPLSPDLFVVVAYNFILPNWLIDYPLHKTINLHPSLLPKLRGASPIRTAIMEDRREDIGVTVMLLDEKMDHGPILEQMHMTIADENWPVPGPELDEALARMGGALLADTIPAYITGEIIPQEQEHNAATYCSRFSKSDSELHFDPTHDSTGEAAWQNWLKVNAFAGIGETFFIHDGTRVKVTRAEFSAGKFRPTRVIPEGKKEIPFTQYIENIS